MKNKINFKKFQWKIKLILKNFNEKKINKKINY